MTTGPALSSAREAWTHFRKAAEHLARLDAWRLEAICRKSH